MIQRPEWLLAIYALCLAIAIFSLQRISAHSTSRLATIESLVERRTLSIDASTYVDTIDKVKIGPHFYSHQPPGHAVLTAILYYPLYHLGLRFSRGRNVTYAILTLLTNGFSTILALVFFWKALAWLNLPHGLRVLLPAGVACGTLVLPFSTTFNSHGFASAWLFIGFYWLLRSATVENPRRYVLLSGLACSMCAALDHGTFFIYAALGAALLLHRTRRRHLLWFVLPALMTLAPTAAYYYSVGGSFKPFAARPELFDYPGSPWTEVKPHDSFREELTGKGWNSPQFAVRYGILCLFGPRGFLIYNPLIWIAFYGIAHTIRRRLQFWREAAAIAAGTAIMVVYYSFASTNYSGWTYSIRWFVPALFLWWFFAAAACDWLASRKWIVAILAPLGVFYAVAGVANPWPPPNLGYATPLVNINRMRAPLHSLSLSFSSDAVPRGGDGKWPFALTVRETEGVGVIFTGLFMDRVDHTSGIVSAFGGNHLPAHGVARARLNLSGYTPPYDLEFEIAGQDDHGRRVTARGAVRLLP